MLSQRGNDKNSDKTTESNWHFFLTLTPSHFYPEEIPQVREVAMNYCHKKGIETAGNCRPLVKASDSLPSFYILNKVKKDNRWKVTLKCAAL